MRRAERSATTVADQEVPKTPLTDPEEERQSGKLVLRSYDHQRGYDIEVTITDQGGTHVFQEQFALFPEETESISDPIPSGTFTITASSKAAQQRTLETRLDSSPDQTAVVEVGNGILSLTAGF